MAAQGDIVLTIGADVTGLTSAGQAGVSSLTDLERAAKKSEGQLLAMGKAALEFKGQIGKLAKENKELYEELRKAGQAAQANQDAFNKLTGVQRDFAKSARDSAAAFEAFDKSRAQVDNLRASIDPLFAASKRYEAALGQLDNALEQGAISAREHANMVDMLSASYLRADAASDAMGAGMGRMGMMSGSAQAKLQQVGFQIQDFAVQVGAGTSATQAFAQQFPQLAGAFGPVGAAVGTLAAVLIPLGAAFFAAGAQANAFEDAMTNVKDAMQGMQDAHNIVSMSMDELIAKYGEAAHRVREFALAQAELQAAQAADRLRDQIPILDGLIRQYADLRDRSRAWKEELERIAADFGLTNAKAREFRGILLEMRQADTFEQQQIALEKIVGFLKANNVELSQMPPELQAAVSEMLALSTATDEARALMSKLGAEARNVTIGVPLYAQGLSGDALLPPSPLASGGSSSGVGGGSSADPRQARLDALLESLKTEGEITAEWYASSLEALQAASDAELAALGGKYSAIERLEQEHQDRLSGIRDAGNQWGVQAALEGGAAILGAMASTNKKAQKAQAIFAAAAALMSTYQGAAKELEKGTFGFASAAAVIAKGIGFVSAIKSAGSGGGGSVARGGGSAAPAAAAPAQAPTQTLNFTVQNDQFGFGERIVRQIASQLNEASRNGSTLRATVS